ncbi:hypothetical protein ScPMuIL_008466 [Solemya velum]
MSGPAGTFGLVLLLPLVVHFSVAVISVETELPGPCKSCVDRSTMRKIDGPPSCKKAFLSTISNCINVCQYETQEDVLYYLYRSVQMEFLAQKCSSQMLSLTCDELHWDCDVFSSPRNSDTEGQDKTHDRNCTGQSNTLGHSSISRNTTCQQDASAQEGQQLASSGSPAGLAVGVFFVGLIVGPLLLLLFVFVLSKTDNKLVQIKYSISFFPDKPTQESRSKQWRTSEIPIYSNEGFFPNGNIHLDEVYMSNNTYEIPNHTSRPHIPVDDGRYLEPMSREERARQHLELAEDLVSNNMNKVHDYIELESDEHDYATVSKVSMDKEDLKTTGEDNKGTRNKWKPQKCLKPNLNIPKRTSVLSGKETVDVLNGHVCLRAQPLDTTSNTNVNTKRHTDPDQSFSDESSCSENSGHEDEYCSTATKVKDICAVFEQT